MKIFLVLFSQNTKILYIAYNIKVQHGDKTYDIIRINGMVDKDEAIKDVVKSIFKLVL